MIRNLRHDNYQPLCRACEPVRRKSEGWEMRAWDAPRSVRSLAFASVAPPSSPSCRVSRELSVSCRRDYSVDVGPRAVLVCWWAGVGERWRARGRRETSRRGGATDPCSPTVAPMEISLCTLEVSVTTCPAIVFAVCGYFISNSQFTNSLFTIHYWWQQIVYIHPIA